MKRLISVLLVYLMIVFVFSIACDVPQNEEVAEQIELNAGYTKFISDIEIDTQLIESKKRTSSRLDIINIMEEQEEVIDISQSDLDLLATLVHAEAGNQPLAGKRAVVDVVLNRVDSSSFPNTIAKVIYQDGQFSCMDDGNFDRALYTKDETDYEAVILEITERTDSEIIYFQTEEYCSYGTPAYIIGDHYFTKK